MNEPEDAQPKIQGDGNVAANKVSALVIQVTGGSTVQNVIQAVIHLPAWAWITGVAILAIAGLCIAVMFFNTLSTLRPRPELQNGADEDKPLILVAKFVDANAELSGELDLGSIVHGFISSTARDRHPNVKVLPDPAVITNSRDAQNLGVEKGAKIVVWGWYDSESVYAYADVIIGQVASGEIIKTQTSKPLIRIAGSLPLTPEARTYVAHVIRGLTDLAIEPTEGVPQAISEFNDAIKASENLRNVDSYCEVYLWRAMCRLLLGEYKTAVRDYDRALLTAQPKCATGYFERATAQLGLAHYEAAIIDYTEVVNDISHQIEVIQIEPDLSAVYYKRGVAYKHLGDMHNAISDFTYFLEVSTDPDRSVRAEQYLRELRGD